MERRHLDADRRFAGNRCDDPDRFGLHVEGDVVFEGFDLLHFYADRRLHFEGGDRGAAVDFADLRIDAKTLQGLFQDGRLAPEIFFQLGLIDFLLGRREEIGRGQLIGAVIFDRQIKGRAAGGFSLFLLAAILALVFSALRISTIFLRA